MGVLSPRGSGFCETMSCLSGGWLTSVPDACRKASRSPAIKDRNGPAVLSGYWLQWELAPELGAVIVQPARVRIDCCLESIGNIAPVAAIPEIVSD